MSPTSWVLFAISGPLAKAVMTAGWSVAVVSPPWTLPSGLLTAPAVLRGSQVPVWLALLVLAVFGTVLPCLAGLRALRDLPSAPARVLALVEPLVAAVLAWLLLGQALGLTRLAGAAILLTGAVLVQPAGRKTVPDGPDPAQTQLSRVHQVSCRSSCRVAGPTGASACHWDRWFAGWSVPRPRHC
ncbi:MAG: DMT family transporter [Kibdelosporangium sp.]